MTNKSYYAIDKMINNGTIHHSEIKLIPMYEFFLNEKPVFSGAYPTIEGLTGLSTSEVADYIFKKIGARFYVYDINEPMKYMAAINTVFGLYSSGSTNFDPCSQVLALSIKYRLEMGEAVDLVSLKRELGLSVITNICEILDIDDIITAVRAILQISVIKLANITMDLKDVSPLSKQGIDNFLGVLGGRVLDSTKLSLSDL